MAGKAYFVSDGEPVNCWGWMNELLALSGLPPVLKSISLATAWRIGACFELLLPLGGRVFISVKDKDKNALLVSIAKDLTSMGFKIEATKGTAAFLKEKDITVEVVKKVKEGRPHIVDHLKNGDIDIVINTVFGSASQADSYGIRRTTLNQNVPYFTTLSGARAATRAINSNIKNECSVKTIQEYIPKTMREFSASMKSISSICSARCSSTW